MFLKHPMSENLCRGDWPVAPTSLVPKKHHFWANYSSSLSMVMMSWKG